MPSAAAAAAIEVVLFTGEAILLAREAVIPFSDHIPCAQDSRVATPATLPQSFCVPFAAARIEPALSLRRTLC
jgi:hypothetical protein